MNPELTTSQKSGAKASILVIMLVLVLFVLILVAGHPIMFFGSGLASVAYTIVVYTPVLALCALAYRRLR
jgi:flagellar basal body-associated protein FliL